MKTTLLLGLLGLGAAMSPHTAVADGDDKGRQVLPVPVAFASTVPDNGDTNPYAVAFVPPGFGSSIVNTGDILVDNFNDAAGLQGTGTTIVDIPPAGSTSPPTVFFESPQPGLTNALAVLKDGLVLVGNVPTTDGTFATIGQGTLQVVDANGNLRQTFRDATFLDGPWGLAVDEDSNHVSVFVSNVLSGTVSRLDATVRNGKLKIHDRTTIASGYAHMSDPTALVLGPAGLVFDDRRDILYVANSADNTIYAIDRAEQRTTSDGVGTIIFQNPLLHGPVGLARAPNRHFVTANTDPTASNDPAFPSELIEFTVTGKFVANFPVDPKTGGAFALAFGPSLLGDDFVLLAAVNDNENQLQLYNQPAPCGR